MLSLPASDQRLTKPHPADYLFTVRALSQANFKDTLTLEVNRIEPPQDVPFPP